MQLRSSVRSFLEMPTHPSTDDLQPDLLAMGSNLFPFFGSDVEQNTCVLSN